MKKQLLILTTALLSLSGFAQIEQNDTTICIGDSLVLNVSNTVLYQSCTGQSLSSYTTWTPIAPTDSYTNIIKENSSYYLRAQNNVYESTSLNGPWTSMNFNTQVGNTLAGRMLGMDWNNRLIVSTGHGSLYAFDNGSWVDIGLGGFGCGGNFINKLANNRIIVMKGGFMRDLYTSDNNGLSFTNVTNVDNDYWDMLVSPNGFIYACGGSNTPSMTGLVKSSDNGSSFSQINSQLGISYCSGFAKDCSDNIYAVADNKIFKSIDGNIWDQQCVIPSYFTINPGYSFLVVASNNDYYLYGYSSPTICGFFKSLDQGVTWSQITDLPTAAVNIFNVKEIDGNIIVATTQGLFAKTLTSNYTYLWSSGETAPSITVQPTVNNYYSLATTLNGNVTLDSIQVSLSIAPSAGLNQTICQGDSITLSGSGAESYSWDNSVIDGQSFIPVISTDYVVIGTDANGCIGTDTLTVLVNNTSTSILTETALDSYTLNGQTYTQSGTYTQVLPNAVGCDSTITLNLSLDFTGLQELENSFTISPNPAKDQLNVFSPSGISEDYFLLDAQGRKVLTGKLTGTNTTIDISKLAAGSYLVQVGEEQLPVRIVKN